MCLTLGSTTTRIEYVLQYSCIIIFISSNHLNFGSEADCTFASIGFGIPPLPAPTSIPKATTLLTASGPRQGISSPTSPDVLRERWTIFNHQGSHPKSRGWPKKYYFLNAWKMYNWYSKLHIEVFEPVQYFAIHRAPLQCELSCFFECDPKNMSLCISANGPEFWCEFSS